MRGMVRKKVFTEVIVKYTMEGSKIPLCIIWEDGRKFKIDKVLDSRPAPSLRAGGQGMRYTCRIMGKDIYLWFEEGRWCVEGRV